MLAGYEHPNIPASDADNLVIPWPSSIWIKRTLDCSGAKNWVEWMTQPKWRLWLCVWVPKLVTWSHRARAGEKLIGSQQPTMVTNAGNRLCFSSNVIGYHNKAINLTMMIYLCWAEQNKPTHFVLRKTNIKQCFFVLNTTKITLGILMWHLIL